MSEKSLIPISSSISSSLSLRDHVFAVPKNPKKRTVVSEELYTDTIGDIIERDFFPDLKKIKIWRENQLYKMICGMFLYRKKSGIQSAELQKSAQRRSLQINEWERIDTPIRVSADRNDSMLNEDSLISRSLANGNVLAVPKSVGLNQFLANITSEDNDSYVLYFCVESMQIRSNF